MSQATISDTQKKANARTRKSDTLATVLPDHHVQLVFKQGTSYSELVKLQQLEEEGVIALGDCQGAISLTLANREWKDKEPASRTFTFYITEQYTFVAFRERLDVDLFESVTLLD